MDKKQAEDVITSTYNTLIKKLHMQKNFNPWLLIHDLHQLVKALQTGDSGPTELHSGQHEVEEKNKATDQERHESYTQTKESVELINQEQQRLIEASKENHEVKIDEVIDNFNYVHSQISTEMKNATHKNKTLNKKIKI